MNYKQFVQSLCIPDVGMTGLDYALQKINHKNNDLILEFGVYTGHTITKIAETFKNHTVYGFDSFEGLPEEWVRNDGSFKKGCFAVKNLPNVPSNVKLIKGWFNQTLPKFIEEHRGRKVTFLHIDCDLYSSTKCVFDLLYGAGMLADRVLIVFDELVNYSTYKEHELKALWEFLETSNYKVEWLGMKGKLIKENIKDFGAEYQSVACWITGASSSMG